MCCSPLFEVKHIITQDSPLISTNIVHATCNARARVYHAKCRKTLQTLAIMRRPCSKRFCFLCTVFLTTNFVETCWRATLDVSAENKLHRNCKKRNVPPLLFQSAAVRYFNSRSRFSVEQRNECSSSLTKILLFFLTDTSFMYIITCLGIVKLYQTRHPDIAANAHLVYAGFAVIIFLAMIGVVSD